MIEQLYFYDVESKQLGKKLFTSWDDAFEAFDVDNGDLVVLSFFDGVVDEVTGYVDGADEGEEFQRIERDEEDFVNELLGKTLEELEG